MNRAQKNAWFGLGNCLLAIGYFVVFFLGQRFACVPGFKFQARQNQWEIFVDFAVRHWQFALIAFPVAALILLLIPRKKQSLAEPDFDEMDTAIENKAIRFAFISVWFLWPLTLLLIMLIMLRFSLDNTPLPPLIFFCLVVSMVAFVICMTIYFLTKIILYRKQTEGGAA